MRKPNLSRNLPFLLLAALAFGGCSKPQTATPAATAGSDVAQRTPLDEYVAAPDSNYTYHLVNTVPGTGFTTYALEMTSQAWLTTNEVDRPLWKHWLTIIRPDKIDVSKALLFITGGANDGKIPQGPDASFAQIAVTTRSTLAELRMVPNQPLVFAGETEEIGRASCRERV